MSRHFGHSTLLPLKRLMLLSLFHACTVHKTRASTIYLSLFHFFSCIRMDEKVPFPMYSTKFARAINPSPFAMDKHPSSKVCPSLHRLVAFKNPLDQNDDSVHRSGFLTWNFEGQGVLNACTTQLPLISFFSVPVICGSNSNTQEWSEHCTYKSCIRH